MSVFPCPYCYADEGQPGCQWCSQLAYLDGDYSVLPDPSAAADPPAAGRVPDQARRCPFCLPADRDPANCWWCQGTGTLTEQQEQTRLEQHPKFTSRPLVISQDAMDMLERVKAGETVELDEGLPDERTDKDIIIHLELSERELREVLACIRAHGRGGQIPPQARRDYLERLLDDQWEEQHPFSCL